MKVILLTDVSKVGRKGDLVDVAEGYGRNFLIPRKMAEEATREKLKDWEQRQKTKEVRARREEEAAWSSRALLQGKQVVLKVSAGERGKLFGSVTAAQVAERIQEKYGVPVDKKDVRLPSPVKELGSYPFSIKLHQGVEADMTLKVEDERVE
ncbi:MAG TPA: 50S ribosomal protein L9 [Synergistales bacterium]|nr:50S ribosomal protein L9 [Synergistales bacterium]HPC75404.1 50S ribosomal protein L9 [Synergistales bacterium]HRS48159.1 50S ribosomal protein L9 [Thermovirgaceae bacterium]HRU90647.1 50S ribosomal protein L9 [Thermovirgaceae bacterium]